MKSAMLRLVELESCISDNAALRTEVTDHIFSMITGCKDRALRRELLDIRRAVHNRRRLPDVEFAPDSIRTLLARLLDSDRAVDTARTSYEEAVASDERLASESVNRAFAPGSLLGQSLLVANTRLWTALSRRKSPKLASVITEPRRRRLRDETLFRYLSRAAMRTAPFSGFTSFGLVCIHRPDSINESSGRGARSIVRLSAEVLGPLLRRIVAAQGTRRMVRLNPMHAEVAGVLKFVDLPDSGQSGWSFVTIQALDVVRHLIKFSDPIVWSDLAQSLENTDPTVDWIAVLESLGRAGLIRDEVPRPSYSLDNQAFGNPASVPVCAERLQVAAELATSWAAASPHRQSEVLRQLAGIMDAGPVSTLRYDLVDEDPFVARLLPQEGQLRQDLLPLCRLARASASEMPHRMLVSLFLQAFPEHASVPLPDFLLRVLAIDGIESQLRKCTEPPAWFGTPLQAFVEQAVGDVVTCPPMLFQELPAVSGELGICAFLQLEVRDDSLTRTDYVIACNGIQSGRGKYLSRYLSSDPPECALRELRAKLRAYRPMVVELTPGFDSSLQLHPPMACWSLNLFGEAPPTGQPEIKLGEIMVSVDPDHTRLRLHVPRIGHDVQFVHLGFVRDCLLPTPLLAVRVMSANIREDTVAERCLIYDVLDVMDARAGRDPRRSRPRLVVGRLVIERRRWVLPFEEIRFETASPLASAWRELNTCFDMHRLPKRCWVRTLHERAGWTETTPLFIDVRTPYAPALLDRLRRRAIHGKNWWVITEATCGGEPPCGRDGRRHAVEMVIDVDC